MQRPKRAGGHTLANERLSLSFDGKTGELTSMRNLETGNEYLRGERRGGNIFAVHHGFTGLFDVTAPNGGTPRLAVDPASVTRSIFGPREATHVAFAERSGKASRRLAVTYTGTLWKAVLTLTLASGSSTVECDLAVTNTDTIPASCLCVFPYVSGLRLGSGKRTKMVTLSEAGYIRPLWCDYEGGIYGNAGQMSMQWGAAFDPDSGDAFGFIVRDAELRNKDIHYRKPSIEVRYFPPANLFPGETIRLPRAALMVYSGDWKPTAEAYHRWFVSAFPPVRQPPWIRSLDSHLGQWFRKRKPGAQVVGVPGLENHLKSFEELPDVYRRLPVGCIEFAFHCEGSSRLHSIDGEKHFWHTDGDNVVRADMGGARALRKGIAGTHALGMHFSFYVEGYIVPFDADIIAKQGALSWTVMNRDGSYLGSYTRQGFVHMCPGCAEWQDHLARTSARLVRETGADGLRLDSLGYYFYPCYNPAHGHHSPWDFNRWMDELLGKVARAVRAVRPDCLLTTETGVDFYARHFNGALTQQGHPRELVSVFGDVAPMRVALPEYYMIPHNPCGPLAAALMGYPGGSGGSQAGGPLTELDKLWRSVRFAAAETIRWGDAAAPNPVASRPDVECRIFNGAGIKAVIAARPDLRRKPGDYPEQHRGTYLNSDIDTRKDRVAYTVAVETGGRAPSAVYLYDVETLRVGAARVVRKDDKVRIATRSNWLMAVLCYGRPPLATSMEVAGPVVPGRRCTIRIWAIGPDGVVSARQGRAAAGSLWIPGLGVGGKGMRVNVPGEVSFSVPRGTKPGSYQCTLTGSGLLGSMRFLEVGRAGR
jgi:hypothetical protein